SGNVAEIHRLAADYGEKILKGRRPAGLPVAVPAKFDLTVNLKTAKALGLQIPDRLLAIADQVLDWNGASSSCAFVWSRTLHPWLGRPGSSGCANEVILSLKGANSPTRGRKIRSTGPKARARVSDGPNSLIELKKQLEARTRELDEARHHADKARRQLAEAQRQVREALEQQNPTSEILGAVARSSTNVQNVLDTMCQSAARLCEAYDASIWCPDGDRLVLVAHHGPITQIESVPFVRGSVLGRSVLDKQTIHTADIQSQVGEFPDSSEYARRLGFRTGLYVPLIREGVAIGVIALRRTEARLFTERQVALLQTFAAQAVIAIENTRVLNELRQRTDDLSESLEQQTATSEVLRVI